MLGVGDAGRMLNYLRERRTARLDEPSTRERKGQLLLEIYGTGTSPTTTLVLPTDDEGVTDATYAEHFQLASAMSKPLVSEEASKDAASALKLVSFDELKKQKNDFTFVPEPVLEETVNGETAENNNLQAKPGSLLRAMFPPMQPAKLVRLLMFIQHANKPAEKVEVDVPEDCNVGKVVEITKKVYVESNPSAAAVVDRTWVMRQAEDDGTVEDDDPPLDPKKAMAGFMKLGRSFALEYTAGDTARADSRTVAKLVKVILPNCGSQTMMYDPNMMVLELLRKICEKDSHLHYTPAEYAFTFDSKDAIIPGDISMRDLEPDQGMLTLRLTKRQVEVEDTRTEKSYNVVKLKRFVHQERTITIAQDIIKNESKAANKDTKKPQRMIRDVKFAALVDKKPRLFNLQFKNEAKVYTYKAQSEAEAREMVSKIQWNMNKVASSAN